MTVFDLIAVLVVAISVGFSIWRGLVREVLALLSWVAAVLAGEIVCRGGCRLVACLLEPSGIAYCDRLHRRHAGELPAVVRVSAWCSCILIAKVAGLTASDRMLGSLFGLVRGLVIVVIMVLLGGMTSEPREPYWRHALFSSRWKRSPCTRGATSHSASPNTSASTSGHRRHEAGAGQPISKKCLLAATVSPAGACSSRLAAPMYYSPTAGDSPLRSFRDHGVQPEWPYGKTVAPGGHRATGQLRIYTLRRKPAACAAPA